MRTKAASDDYNGRFREVIADPLNLLIARHPDAGLTEGEFVVLHNGHRVALNGEFSYYDDFSRVLSLNRGVHEPWKSSCFRKS